MTLRETEDALDHRENCPDCGRADLVLEVADGEFHLLLDGARVRIAGEEGTA